MPRRHILRSLMLAVVSVFGCSNTRSGPELTAALQAAAPQEFAAWQAALAAVDAARHDAGDAALTERRAAVERAVAALRTVERTVTERDAAVARAEAAVEIVNATRNTAIARKERDLNVPIAREVAETEALLLKREAEADAARAELVETANAEAAALIAIARTERDATVAAAKAEHTTALAAVRSDTRIRARAAATAGLAPREKQRALLTARSEQIANADSELAATIEKAEAVFAGRASASNQTAIRAIAKANDERAAVQGALEQTRHAASAEAKAKGVTARDLARRHAGDEKEVLEVEGLADAAVANANIALGAFEKAQQALEAALAAAEAAATHAVRVYEAAEHAAAAALLRLQEAAPEAWAAYATSARVNERAILGSVRQSRLPRGGHQRLGP